MATHALFLPSTLTLPLRGGPTTRLLAGARRTGQRGRDGSVYECMCVYGSAGSARSTVTGSIVKCQSMLLSLLVCAAYFINMATLLGPDGVFVQVTPNQNMLHATSSTYVASGCRGISNTRNVI